MVMRPVPWQTGEICGPDSAKSLTKPAVLKRDLTKNKKRLLVVGSEAVGLKHGKGDMIDYAIELAKAGKMDVIATGGAIKAFIEKGFEGAKTMGAMEVAFRLPDPEWVGPFGKGPYNLLLIYGIPYYMQWNPILHAVDTLVRCHELCNTYDCNCTWTILSTTCKVVISEYERETVSYRSRRNTRTSRRR
jgi:CO dehydrogenase/acetyl-CoA synthase complex epsilon subunit